MAVSRSSEGVHHHRGVDAVEGAPVEQEDLAPAALLGGRAEDAHREAEVVGHPGECQAGADGGGGDDVVAAGMAHAGQRVVFRTDRRPTSGRTRRAAKAVGRSQMPR